MKNSIKFLFLFSTALFCQCTDDVMETTEIEDLAFEEVWLSNKNQEHVKQLNSIYASNDLTSREKTIGLKNTFAKIRTLLRKYNLDETVKFEDINKAWIEHNNKPSEFQPNKLKSVIWNQVDDALVQFLYEHSIFYPEVIYLQGKLVNDIPTYYQNTYFGTVYDLIPEYSNAVYAAQASTLSDMNLFMNTCKSDMLQEKADAEGYAADHSQHPLDALDAVNSTITNNRNLYLSAAYYYTPTYTVPVFDWDVINVQL